MKILKGLYDSVNKRLMIDFSCSLLKEHHEVLDSTVVKYKKAGLLPKETEVQKLEESRCLIAIPVDIPGADSLGNGERIPNIPKDILEKINSVIEDFRRLALEKELGSTEFIPLTGYPLKDLQTDIVEAIKNKRNFCLIDKYSEYKKFSKRETTKLQQYKVMYSSNDYSEIALSIYEGDLKSLREQYTSKLEEVDWD